uniref:Uncharacterized protein n=1 Tax=Rhizophagus irregularis (strain DAOM 181602 / DAOM 197198 / MUCL 43194) TaxID=747089 RepID=U9UVK5_RHIID
MIILKSKTLTTNNLDQFVRVTNNDNDLILQQQSLENTMHILTSTQIATKNINDLENKQFMNIIRKESDITIVYQSFMCRILKGLRVAGHIKSNLRLVSHQTLINKGSVLEWYKSKITKHYFIAVVLVKIVLIKSNA